MSARRAHIAWAFAGALAAALAGCTAEKPGPVQAPIGWIDEGPLLSLTDGPHDPASLMPLTLGRVDSAEVVVLRFEGALGPVPMPAPAWVILGRSRGVLRVVCSLEPVPGRPPSAWTDTTFALGGLVRAAYALRTLENHVAVDLHLAEPVLARARVGGPDSALVIELRRGGPPLDTLPDSLRSPRVVLLEPRHFDPLTVFAVEGYARTFEANVLIRLRGGMAPLDTFTTATDGMDLWGEFRLELPQAAAAETVRAGEFDMETGAPYMVEVVRRR